MSRLRAILAAGGKCKTADGSDAEIFAERNRMFYGRVQELSCRWYEDGCVVALQACPSPWDIPAPAPVTPEFHFEPPTTGLFAETVTVIIGDERSTYQRVVEKPLPAPVRKWRWVMRAPSGDLWVTSGHYATEQECAVTHNSGWKAIQRIDSTEINEPIDVRSYLAARYPAVSQ